AHVDPAGDQRAHQALGAVHDAAVGGASSIQHGLGLVVWGSHATTGGTNLLTLRRRTETIQAVHPDDPSTNGRKACSSIIAPIASSRAPCRPISTTTRSSASRRRRAISASRSPT